MGGVADQQPTAAAKPRRVSGCTVLVGVPVLLIIVGIVWNLITGGVSDGKHVTPSDYPGTWPLTVQSATIGCQQGRDVYVQVGSIRYALNGTAKADGYDSVDPIWADDPSMPGLKMDIAPLRTSALALC